MIAEHYSAVHDRLTANDKIAGHLHDSVLVDASGKLIRETYWILFGGAPDHLDNDRLAQEQTPDADAEFVYTVRSVSTSASGCRAAQALAFTQLVGFTPDIGNRDCSAIKLTRPDEPRPDFEVSPPLYYSDDEYTLRSSRA